MAPLDVFIYIILPAALWLDSASNRNEYQEYFLGGKGGRCVGLETLPNLYADCIEMWEHQTPGTPQGLSRAVMGFLYHSNILMFL